MKHLSRHATANILMMNWTIQKETNQLTCTATQLTVLCMIGKFDSNGLNNAPTARDFYNLLTAIYFYNKSPELSVRIYNLGNK